MQAFVSDQSANFGSVAISAGNDFSVVAAIDLPPGSWVVLATVALAGGPPTNCDVQVVFLLDGQLYTSGVQCDIVGGPNSFLVIPLTTGLALDRKQTLAIGCRATQAGVSSQPTTITAIQVESVTMIRDQYLGAPPA
jgi:hypothetical protein